MAVAALRRAESGGGVARGGAAGSAAGAAPIMRTAKAAAIEAAGVWLCPGADIHHSAQKCAAATTAKAAAQVRSWGGGDGGQRCGPWRAESATMAAF